MLSKVRNERSSDKPTSPYMGFSIAIVFLLIGALLFFRWDLFGSENLFKFLSIPFVFFGFAGIGFEINKRDEKSGASYFGLGLSFIFLGLIIGSLNINFSLNILVLLFVAFGLIPLIASIFTLINVKNLKLNLLYRTIMIIGQVAGSILAIIELVQILFA